eukprot:605389-Pleurochrysis_carterae.AAC.1
MPHCLGCPCMRRVHDSFAASNQPRTLTQCTALTLRLLGGYPLPSPVAGPESSASPTLANQSRLPQPLMREPGDVGQVKESHKACSLARKRSRHSVSIGGRYIPVVT